MLLLVAVCKILPRTIYTYAFTYVDWFLDFLGRGGLQSGLALLKKILGPFYFSISGTHFKILLNKIK